MSTIDTEAQKANVEVNKAADNVEEKKIDSDDVAIAAGQYGQMVKQVKAYSKEMSAKGLARVMIALAEFPYGENYPKFRSKPEEYLFTFMLTAQSAKTKIADALKDELSTVESEAVDGIVKEELAKKGEQTNG